MHSISEIILIHPDVSGVMMSTEGLAGVHEVNLPPNAMEIQEALEADEPLNKEFEIYFWESYNNALIDMAELSGMILEEIKKEELDKLKLWALEQKLKIRQEMWSANYQEFQRKIQEAVDEEKENS